MQKSDRCLYRLSFVSNSNGVNSNPLWCVYQRQAPRVSNSNGVNSNYGQAQILMILVGFQTPTE